MSEGTSDSTSDSTSERVRIGILSTANIARKAVGPAVQVCDRAELVAVGSRDQARARAFADELGIERAHGSYDALLDDPNVDAVYVALPNALHESWTVRALQAGKHVLCEKPLAPTAAACLRMGEAARKADRVLMEAFMYRFHPRVLAAVTAVQEGRVGRLAFVDAAFTFRVRRQDDIRLSAALAGGALLDVGCYTVDAARRLVGEQPETVVAVARFDVGRNEERPDGDEDTPGERAALDRYGVDLETAGLLRFPSGAIATVRSALTLPRRETLEIRGDAGSLRLDRAFLPGAGPTELRFEDAAGARSSETVSGKDPYLAMVEAFADRVRGAARPELPASDAKEAAATLRIVERMAVSARTSVPPPSPGEGADVR